MKFSLSELNVHGKENLKLIPPQKKIILIANHESNLDIPAVIGAFNCPVGFIAKKGLGSIPGLGYWIKETGGFLLDRKNLRASRSTLLNATKYNRDKALLIFPEGTRNRQSTVAAFKTGSFRLAFEKDSVVVPITICGSRRKFEGNGYRLKKGKIFIKIHKPVEPLIVNANDKQQFASNIQKLILDSYIEFDKQLKT